MHQVCWLQPTHRQRGQTGQAVSRAIRGCCAFWPLRLPAAQMQNSIELHPARPNCCLSSCRQQELWESLCYVSPQPDSTAAWPPAGQDSKISNKRCTQYRFTLKMQFRQHHVKSRSPRSTCCVSLCRRRRRELLDGLCTAPACTLMHCATLQTTCSTSGASSVPAAPRTTTSGLPDMCCSKVRAPCSVLVACNLSCWASRPANTRERGASEAEIEACCLWLCCVYKRSTPATRLTADLFMGGQLPAEKHQHTTACSSHALQGAITCCPRPFQTCVHGRSLAQGCGSRLCRA